MATSELELTKEENLFKQYYDKLIWETYFARVHLELWERLKKYESNYSKELKQAPHFFTLTKKAHLDDALMTLSRIIRRQKQALTMKKFLDFVQSNLEIFSNESFFRRERQKPDYEEYGTYRMKSHTPITQSEIEEDKQKLLNLEPTIKKLITWRDKEIAHVDRKFLLTGKTVAKEYPLQSEQLGVVIDTLTQILNRYSYAYDSSRFLTNFTREDDVQNIMNFIRFYIHERKKQIEEFRKQARDKG